MTFHFLFFIFVKYFQTLLLMSLHYWDKDVGHFTMMCRLWETLMSRRVQRFLSMREFRFRKMRSGWFASFWGEQQATLYNIISAYTIYDWCNISRCHYHWLLIVKCAFFQKCRDLLHYHFHWWCITDVDYFHYYFTWHFLWKYFCRCESRHYRDAAAIDGIYRRNIISMITLCRRLMITPPIIAGEPFFAVADDYFLLRAA